MLSVLIPVIDWNPYSLVASLAAQLIQCGQSYEILVSDDSDFTESSKISQLVGQIPGVIYFCRENPLGRSANRNFLGDQAKHEFLLFMDGDAGMAEGNYIQNYLDRLSSDTVLCGGTLYNEEPPENSDFLLRWKYGRSREQSDAKNRQKRPWKSFSTFNFLIPAKVFKGIRFDESIKGYGHEDTIFGINLHQSGVKIIHLNNGLIHLGLEPSSIYLEKIRESGANLCLLDSRMRFPSKYIGDFSLLASWKRLKKLKIAWLVAAWFRYRRKSIEKRLCGPDPSLVLLDLYKLGAISHIG
ncbi:MAG: glycosyltransferase [Porphyromonadaceae bacterium]|nr:MAG: glycosyltransferase [Porphyromonadaceae bacterium]